jgi:hypothetical protein
LTPRQRSAGVPPAAGARVCDPQEHADATNAPGPARPRRQAMTVPRSNPTSRWRPCASNRASTSICQRTPRHHCAGVPPGAGWLAVHRGRLPRPPRQPSTSHYQLVPIYIPAGKPQQLFSTFFGGAAVPPARLGCRPPSHPSAKTFRLQVSSFRVCPASRLHLPSLSHPLASSASWWLKKPRL